MVESIKESTLCEVIVCLSTLPGRSRFSLCLLYVLSYLFAVAPMANFHTLGDGDSYTFRHISCLISSSSGLSLSGSSHPSVEP